MAMTRDEVRAMLQQGDSVCPCSHLRAHWSIRSENQMQTFWEKAPKDQTPEGKTRWVVGCAMCNHDSIQRSVPLWVIVAETREGQEDAD